MLRPKGIPQKQLNNAAERNRSVMAARRGQYYTFFGFVLATSGSVLRFFRVCVGEKSED